MTIPASTLWYAIESCLTAIERDCSEASAASLVARASDGGPPALRAEVLPKGTALQPPTSLARAIDAPGTAVTLADAARSTDIRRHNPKGPDFQALRDSARSRLEALKESLDVGLSLRDAYFVFYPLVIDTDERLANIPGYGVEWESLHSEWFKSDDGGDNFYKAIDQLLSEPETHPLVYQAFYLCLRRGFVGRLERSEERVQLAAKIAEKIPVSALPTAHAERPPANVPRGTWLERKIGVARAPWYIYGAAGFVTGLTFLAIRAFGQ